MPLAGLLRFFGRASFEGRARARPPQDDGTGSSGSEYARSPPMIQVKRLGHATFTTPDLDGQLHYYSDVLGLSGVERDKNRAFLATATGLEAIALERGDAVALTRLSFQVAPGSDLAALARDLGGLGIKTERRSAISPGIADAITFTDPKGTLIDIFADYGFAKPDAKQSVVTPLRLRHVPP